ncbi:MAG: sugar kinase [Planctomycetota bacterium]
MSDILCIGIVVLDAVGKPIDRHPDRGGLVLFDTLGLHLGGCASNAAAGLRRMGFSAGVVGKLGKDALGQLVIEELRRDKVDTKYMVFDAKVNTSFTFVMVDALGERSFYHTMGANAVFDAKDVSEEAIKSSKIVFVAGVYLMEKFDRGGAAEVVRRAKKAGKITAMDTAMGSDLPNRLGDISPCFGELDYFIPSYEEAKLLSGKTTPKDVAETFHALGVRNVVIKLGDKGCYISNEKFRETIPSYEVKCVDAVGAGDAWCAGFLAGIDRGWDFRESALFGNAVAAHCVQAIGATTGIKTFEEIREFQKRTPMRKG